MDVTEKVRQIAESNYQGVFKSRKPSPENPNWYLFDNAQRTHKDHTAPIEHAKLYISPVLADLPRCLRRVVDILPSLPFRGWKVGRYSFGIARPDKICVYFPSTEEAQAAARIFAGELQGAEAHGVPFTNRQDPHGLLSIGVDPNQKVSQPGFAIQNSWRLWVARKLASAMITAKLDGNYPLSPEQSSLWGLYFLGIDPTNWTVRDSNFWRN